MKRLLSVLILLLPVLVLAAPSNRFPINKGFLQTDLDGNGLSITNLASITDTNGNPISGGSNPNALTNYDTRTPVFNGAGLTNLSDAGLSSNVALKNANNVFTGSNAISGSINTVLTVPWMWRTDSFTVTGMGTTGANGTYVFDGVKPGISFPILKWTNTLGNTFAIIAGDVDEFDTMVMTNSSSNPDLGTFVYDALQTGTNGQYYWGLNGGTGSAPVGCPVFTAANYGETNLLTPPPLTNFWRYLAATNLWRAKRAFICGQFMGQTFYSPGGSYNPEYLRDFGMAVGAFPDYFHANEVSNTCVRFMESVAANAIPDGLYNDSTAIPSYDFDGPFIMADLMYQHWKKTGSYTLITNYQATLSNCFAAIPLSNHCVYITAANHGWGFHDGLSSVGMEAACTVMRYRALRERGEMLAAAGQLINASNDFFEAAVTLTNIETQLLDSSIGLLRTASAGVNGIVAVNTNHDVPASAMAVCFGAVRTGISDQIVEALIARLPGGSLWPVQAITYQGAVLLCPSNSIPFSATHDAAGIGDNGAAWPAFSGWLAAAVARHDANKALQLISELEARYIADGSANWAQEWYSGSGSVGGGYYAASAANPLEFFKSGFPVRPSLDGSAVWTGTISANRLDANITTNNASTLSGGTVPLARMDANITTNNASTISSGTLADARLSGNVSLLGSSISEGELSTSDVTTANASTSKHGFLPKLNNDATYYMDGTGAWSVPAGGGGGSGTDTNAWHFRGDPTPATTNAFIGPTNGNTFSIHMQENGRNNSEVARFWTQSGDYGVTFNCGSSNDVTLNNFGWNSFNFGAFNSFGPALGPIGASLFGGAYNSVGSADLSYPTILGGKSNTVSASFGYASGYRAKVNHAGAWVYSDSQNTNFNSLAADSADLRVHGGMYLIGSDSAQAQGNTNMLTIRTYWWDATTNYNGIFLLVTNQTAGAQSKLMDLVAWWPNSILGRFSVYPNGSVTNSGDYSVGSNLWVNGGAINSAQTISANSGALGLALTNTSVASSGNQMFSPSISLAGNGWKTASTAASQPVRFDIVNVPVQGSANPSAMLVISNSINNAAFTESGWLRSDGASKFGSLSLGGTSSSFTMLTNGDFATSRLAVRKADNSAYASVDANQFEVFTGSSRTAVFADNGSGGRLLFTTSAGLIQFNNNTAGLGFAATVGGVEVNTGTQGAVTNLTAGGVRFPQLPTAPTAAQIGGTVGSVTNHMLVNVGGGLIDYYSDGTTLWSKQLSP